MNKNDSLGDRMKSNYENRSKTFLLRRTPVVIRLDGKAFHTFTRGMKKPYDTILIDTIQKTMKSLCENIQGCKIGYTQSDEITLLLTDYDTLTTDAWFDYNVQKVCSVAASMATLYFNQIFIEQIDNYGRTNLPDWDLGGTNEKVDENILNLLSAYDNKVFKALFDARCFNVPKEEVCNCFIWRQQDATRNAIQMLGQAYFSHKNLHCKSCNDIQDMLMVQKNVNFNNERTDFKRGSCCYKDEYGRWVIDKEIPIFTQDRNFIEKWVSNESLV